MSTDEKTITRVCPQCGKVLEENWKSCPYCGKDLTGAGGTGRTWAIVSIILGAISFLIFGIPLGIAAIICGVVAVAKNDNLGIIGIILGLIGAALAAIVLMIIF